MRERHTARERKNERETERDRERERGHFKYSVDEHIGMDIQKQCCQLSMSHVLFCATHVNLSTSIVTYD